MDLNGPGKWMYIRFEQGRGKTGVPKAYVPYWDGGHPNDASAKVAVESIVALAVAHFRVMCADPNIGHGRDLMPPETVEYRLHNINGGLIEKVEDIKFEHDGNKIAELVLTWRNPADLLIPFGPQ